MSRLVANVFFTEERGGYGQPFDLASAAFIRFSTMFTYDKKFHQCFLLKGKSASFGVAVIFIVYTSGV